MSRDAADEHLVKAAYGKIQEQHLPAFPIG